MRYYASATAASVRAAVARGLLGAIDAPARRTAIEGGWDWCADNGCFSKGYPGDKAFMHWLAARQHLRDTCAFATAPDVLGDAAATLARSAPFLPAIRNLGFSAAFVAQDGLERLEVPWDDFDVLFIGGSTTFKLGTAARSLAAEARANGKPVHMGRVNSHARIAYASALGCASADGTTLARYPGGLAALLGWLYAVNVQEQQQEVLRLTLAP